MKRITLSAPLIFALTLLLLFVSSYSSVLADSSWNVKWYSDPNLCSTYNCTPSQVYLETNVQGGWFHIFYPTDGRAFNEGTDHWGSIWKSTVYFPEGDYVFHSGANDDSMKLFVSDINNNNAIMDLGLSGIDNYTCPAIHLSGDRQVTVIHTNTGGGANINIWWDTNTTVCNPTQTYQVYTGKDGRSWAYISNFTTKPKVHFWIDGVETISTTLWNEFGKDIWMYIPDNADSYSIDGVNPSIDTSSDNVWLLSGNWVLRRWVFVDGYKVTYTRGSKIPVVLSYFNGTNVTVNNLWTTTNGVDFSFIVPDGVSIFELKGGSRPVISDNPSYLFINDNQTRQVYLKSVLVEEDQNRTKISYYNDISPDLVGIHYYIAGDNSEHYTTSWWIREQGYLHFYVPDNVISLVIDKSPVPHIFGPALSYWKNGTDKRWLIRIKTPVATTPTPTATATRTPAPTSTPQPTATPASTKTPPTPIPNMNHHFYLPLVTKP